MEILKKICDMEIKRKMEINREEMTMTLVCYSCMFMAIFTFLVWVIIK